MKPKLLLIRYLDKLLLVGLLALLVWAVITMLRTENKVPGGLADTMKRQADQVAAKIKDSKPPATAVPEPVTQLAGLVATLHTPPVIAPLSGVAFTEARTTYYAARKLLVNVPVTLELPGVELTAPLQVPKEISADFKYDADKNVTTITIDALQDTMSKTVNLVFWDRERTQHEFPIIAYSKPPEAKPLPLANVTAQFSLGNVVLTGILQQPSPPPAAAHGVSARPDFVQAGGFRVYRKFKDAPDSQYELVSPGARVEPLSQADFLGELARNGLSQQTGPVPMGPAVPPAPAGPAPGALPEMSPINIGAPTPEQKIYCIYADSSMTPGETYVYKMVAVPAATGGPEKQVESDFTPMTVEVPANVLFFVKKVSNGMAQLLVQRYFYNEMTRADQTIEGVQAGDPIGSVFPKLRTVPLLPTGAGGTKDNVDLGTGACLVNVVENAPNYVPKITFKRSLVTVPVFDPRTGKWTSKPTWKIDRLFSLTPKPESYVIYLDKKGDLNAKYLGLAGSEFHPKPVVVGAGPAATPGMPGMPGPRPGPSGYRPNWNENE